MMFVVSAPANANVSVHASVAPPPVCVVEVLDDANVMFVVGPETGRVPTSEIGGPRAAHVDGVTDSSTRLPLVCAVPVTDDPDVDCCSVMVSVPFKVRVEMHTTLPVVVVTII